MKSQELKADILSHVMYRLQYEGAVTEYGGKGVSGVADVFALRKTGYTHEFEVKVTKTDLMGELKSIQYIVEKQQRIDEEPKIRPHAKYPKHNAYMENAEGQKIYWKHYRPNQFSFVVTEALVDFAKEGVKGSPYGVYMVNKVEVKCVVRAGYLHKDKADILLVKNMMRKAATEVEYTRRELANGLRCTSCEELLRTRCKECEEKMRKERKYRKDSARCYAKCTDNDDPQCMTKCMAETKQK